MDFDWEERQAVEYAARRERAASARDRSENIAVVTKFEALADAQAWQRSIDRTLAALGLTHAQFWALQNAQWLQDEYDDAMAQWEIARAARLEPSMASKTARRLESLGLLDRAPAFSPRLTYRVYVTERGSELLRRAFPLVAKAADAHVR